MPSNEKILLHRFLEHFRLPLVLVSLLLSDENNLRKLIVRCKDPWKYHNEKHNQLIYQGWRQSHQGQHPTYHHRQGSTDRPVYGLTGPNRSANFRRFLVPARSEIWNFSGSRFQFSPVRFGHVYPDPIFWIHSVIVRVSPIFEKCIWSLSKLIRDFGADHRPWIPDQSWFRFAQYWHSNSSYSCSIL